jgi:phage gp37-like protein
MGTNDLKKFALECNEKFPELEDQWAMVVTPSIVLGFCEELDEADRRAGSAERRIVETSDSLAHIRKWHDEQKVAAGFHRNDPFDKAWDSILEKARAYDQIMTAGTDREQFEAWIRSLNVGYSLEFYDEYTDGRVQGLWVCWQASRAVAPEDVEARSIEVAEIKQARINALRALMGEASQKEFAELHDLDASYLSQLLNGHRTLGEKAAANLEKKIGLPEGSLVMPGRPLTQ